MRMRGRSRIRNAELSKILKTRSKIKMESKVLRRSKRKSPCVSAIFELNDGDVSPEPGEINSEEPQAKIQKTDDAPKSLQVKIDANSSHNLESTSTQNNVKIVEIEPQNTTEVVQQVIREEVEITGIEVVEKPQDSVETTHNIKEVSLEDGEVPDTVDGTQENVKEKRSTSTQDHSENLPLTLTEINSENKPSIVAEDTTEKEPLTACISIKFHDSSIANTYKQRFLMFLENFVEFNISTSSDDLTINITKDVSFDPSEWIVVDEAVCMTQEEVIVPEEELAKELPQTPKLVAAEVMSNMKKKKKKREKKIRELFVLDSTPTLETSKHIVQTKYSTKFLIEDIQNGEVVDKSREGLMPSGQLCFNCGSSHSLKDCPEPKIMGRINANRQKFNMNKNKSLRYHLEEDQKYHQLKPGKISDTLREALGLRKNQLPSYIYQMRLLGYPPGWLEEAKLVRSNLAMYDVDGNNVRETKSSSTSQGLDEEKVIDYPGFNVPLEKGFRDEFKQHGTPPYSQQYNKEKMIDFFKRECLREVDNLETCDMDLDTTNELEKDENIVVQAEVIETKVIENTQIKIVKNIDESHSGIPSPSLTDLEKVKETLLAALNDDKEIKESNDNPNSEKNDLTNSEEEMALASDSEEQKKQGEKVEDNDMQSLTEETSRDSDIDEKPAECDVATSSRDFPTESNSSESVDSVVNVRNSVKTSLVGTPIIKSSTPYARLPNPDNFSKDVSPVINFENLPNSTGKYDQMTGVLQKVRNTLKGLQQKCK